MILHICGNLAAGKTTTVDALQAGLKWPVVTIGRIRNMCQNEWLAWRVVQRLWWAWDSPDLTPGRSGIWVSTGLNAREALALEPHPPEYLRRVWITAPPEVLRQRLLARSDPEVGPDRYWPYEEGWADLQEALMGYVTGDRPLPWSADLTIDTGESSTVAIVSMIDELIRTTWDNALPAAHLFVEHNNRSLYAEIQAARHTRGGAGGHS